MKILNVLYQSSSAYAIPAAVSICSLCENNVNLDEIHIWMIDGGLTKQDREHLRKLASRYKRSITFLSGKATDDMLKQAGVKLWNESYSTFYKIFSFREMTQIDKILYIDADTLILGSLEKLCDFSMNDYACAMVLSAMTKEVKNFIGVEYYYNAGIVYFNLDYWRKHHLESKFLDVIHSEQCSKYTFIGDETLINYVLKGKIKKMPLQYNLESSWGLWGWNHSLYDKLGWESKVYYSDKEIAYARRKPVIAHYVDLTTGRPWDYLNDNPFREEFAQYLKLTKPWKKIDFAMRGIGGNNKAIARLKWAVKKVMPTSVRSKIGFFQHQQYWVKRIESLK